MIIRIVRDLWTPQLHAGAFGRWAASFSLQTLRLPCSSQTRSHCISVKCKVANAHFECERALSEPSRACSAVWQLKTCALTLQKVFGLPGPSPALLLAIFAADPEVKWLSPVWKPKVHLANLLRSVADAGWSLWILEMCFQAWSPGDPPLSGNVLCSQVSQVGKLSGLELMSLHCSALLFQKHFFLQSCSLFWVPGWSCSIGCWSVRVCGRKSWKQREGDK